MALRSRLTTRVRWRRKRWFWRIHGRVPRWLSAMILSPPDRRLFKGGSVF